MNDLLIYIYIFWYIYIYVKYIRIYIYYVIFIYTCSYNMSIWVSVLKPMWYESLPNSSTSAHSMMKPKNHLQTKEIVKLPTNHGWIAWFSKTAIKWKDCQVPCRIFSIGEIDEMDTVYEGFSVTNADAQKNKQEITVAPWILRSETHPRNKIQRKKLGQFVVHTTTVAKSLRTGKPFKNTIHAIN